MSQNPNSEPGTQVAVWGVVTSSAALARATALADALASLERAANMVAHPSPYTPIILQGVGFQDREVGGLVEQVLPLNPNPNLTP